MKKITAIVLLSVMMLSMILASCGEKKIVHCDKCGKEIEISADSNMDDSWQLFCTDCEKELGLDTVIAEN